MSTYDSTVTFPSNLTASGIAAQTRTAHTQEQREELEKTLHHLASRVCELRARLDPVLLPEPPQAEANGMASQPEPTRSAVANHLRQMRDIATGAIRDVESVLNRLDV